LLVSGEVKHVDKRLYLMMTLGRQADRGRRNGDFRSDASP
jgi:hypothetical protein